MNRQSPHAVSLRVEPDSRHARIPLDLDAGDGDPVSAGISLIDAGDMGLAKAGELPFRGDFFHAMGWPSQRVFAVRQMHTRRVIAVGAGRGVEETAREEADGLVSGRESGAILTVTAADCIPVFLSDPVTGAYGIVHSGWKGTGIAGDAVREMAARFGSRPADIRAVIGPGIGPCCYRVPEERWLAFKEAFGAGAVRAPDGAPVLDLIRANEDVLAAEGVVRITRVEDCTCCTPRLGSFRRQGQGFTRMLAFIGPRALFHAARGC